MFRRFLFPAGTAAGAGAVPDSNCTTRASPARRSVFHPQYACEVVVGFGQTMTITNHALQLIYRSVAMPPPLALDDGTVAVVEE